MGFWFNEKERVWIGENITDLNGDAADNFLTYGQPFHPNQPEFDHNYADNYHSSITKPTVRFSQSTVMFDGYGQDVKLGEFDVVQDFVNGDFSLDDGIYSYADLEALGHVTGDTPRVLGKSLYSFGLINGMSFISSGDIDPIEAAYVCQAPEIWSSFRVSF